MEVATGTVPVPTCWLCGVPAQDLTEICADGAVVRWIPQWPPGGGCAHAERPPSAEELLRRGAEALEAIRRLSRLSAG